MREFTRTHFQIVKWASLILAIINFLGVGVDLGLSIYMFTQAWMFPAAAPILTLVLGVPLPIVFGILLIVVYKLYKKAALMDDQFLIEKKGKILGWGIFFAIVLTPSVLFLIISLCCVVGANNYINSIIDGAPYGTVGETVKQGATKVVAGAREVWNDSKANPELNELEKELDELERTMQLLEKLKKFKDLGLITEEEYQAKRSKILKID